MAAAVVDRDLGWREIRVGEGADGDADAAILMAFLGVEQVGAAFAKRFDAKSSGAGATFTAYPWTAGDGSAGYGTNFFDGKLMVLYSRGQLGDVVAKSAGMIQPAGGCVVVVTEPADWFTIKLHSALRFLHLQ